MLFLWAMAKHVRILTSRKGANHDHQVLDFTYYLPEQPWFTPALKKAGLDVIRFHDLGIHTQA